MRQARLKMWDLIYSVCEKELLQTLDNGTKSNSLYLQGHLERKVHEGVPGTESPLLLLLSQIICCLRVSPCFLAPLVCCFLLDFAFFFLPWTYVLSYGLPCSSLIKCLLLNSACFLFVTLPTVCIICSFAP